MREDEAKAVLMESRRASPPRPPVLDMYEMTMRRTDLDFHFDFVKKRIISDPYWIDAAATEKETYGRYKNATFFILACLAPRMANGAMDEVKKRYKQLDEAMEVCDPVEVTGEYVDDERGAYYKLVGNLKVRRGATTEVFGGSAIPVPESKYDSGIEQASENAYSMANCEAKKQYYQALKLAFEVGIIRAEEVEQLRVAKPSAENFRER